MGGATRDKVTCCILGSAGASVSPSDRPALVWSYLRGRGFVARKIAVRGCERGRMDVY